MYSMCSMLNDNNKATKTKKLSINKNEKSVYQKKDLERFGFLRIRARAFFVAQKTHTRRDQKKKKKWISFTDGMTPFTKNKLKISQQHNNPLASKKNRQNK